MAVCGREGPGGAWENPHRPDPAWVLPGLRISCLPGAGRGPAPGRRLPSPPLSTMQILNTLTVLALVVLSFALIVAVPVLYASNDTSGNSNRLILLGGLAWVALVLVNWGMSLFVV